MSMKSIGATSRPTFSLAASGKSGASIFSMRYPKTICDEMPRSCPAAMRPPKRLYAAIAKSLDVSVGSLWSTSTSWLPKKSRAAL